MKTMRKLFFSSLLLILYTGLISNAYASGKELQKTYTWKYNINKDGNIVIDNYDCNLTIHVWDKAETEYHLIVDAKTRTDEDATLLDTYLQNLKFSSSSSSVKFGNGFWETRNNILGRMTMKLKGGKEIGLSEFTLKAELWVPSACRFEVISKYSEINMEDFSGPLKLDLYNDNFYGASVKGNTEITDKYSTIELKEIKDLKADLYNSKLETGNTGNLKIESKYSKVTTLSSGIIDINSYNDKYSIPKTGDITFTSKYSDLKTEAAGQVNLDCYEGTLAIQVARDVKISSKYADFQFGKVENVTISSSYNDKLAAVKMNSLKINESKYCSFRIEELATSVTEADGYEDKFNIMKTGQDFKEMNINGKYVDISLSLPKAVDFRFKAKITYPKLEMDESKLTTTTKIKDGEHLEYNAVKGADKEGMPEIEVNGYEMALKIIGL
jgi:hypothetical protein